MATILINIYREAMELFVNDVTLYSEEGTTQGDPLAMPMYALAIITLIKNLNAAPWLPFQRLQNMAANKGSPP